METQKEKQLTEEVTLLRKRETLLLNGVKELEDLAKRLLDDWRNCE